MHSAESSGNRLKQRSNVNIHVFWKNYLVSEQGVVLRGSRYISKDQADGFQYLQYENVMITDIWEDTLLFIQICITSQHSMF